MAPKTGTATPLEKESPKATSSTATSAEAGTATTARAKTTKAPRGSGLGTRGSGPGTDDRLRTTTPDTRHPTPGPRVPSPGSRPPKKVAAPDTARLYDLLQQTYPDAHCELDFGNAFQLLCATILSAQCTDRRVNMVTPALFAAYPDAHALSGARQEDVEELIRTTGFFRNKAKNLIAMAGALVERHGGEVPRTMEALVVLPGVGRKTANVILGNAYGIDEGITVDTHVQRVAARLGLTAETDPVKIEQSLMPLFPRERWTMLSHLLIFHGRRICDARKPRCGECPLRAHCPSALV